MKLLSKMYAFIVLSGIFNKNGGRKYPGGRRVSAYLLISNRFYQGFSHYDFKTSLKARDAAFVRVVLMSEDQVGKCSVTNNFSVTVSLKQDC